MTNKMMPGILYDKVRMYELQQSKECKVEKDNEAIYSFYGEQVYLDMAKNGTIFTKNLC